MISVFFSKPEPRLLRPRTAGWRQIWVWLPVVFAIAVIATESTDDFSAEHTSSWLRPIFERWYGHVSDGTWMWYHHIARKLGHFVGFALVCLACLRAWLLRLGCREGMTAHEWLMKANWLAVASTAFIASMDEFHQTFIPSRTGKVADVILDTVGGVVLCGCADLLRAVAVWWTGRRSRPAMVAS